MDVLTFPDAPRGHAQRSLAGARTELALARERERAWQERAGQLERANEALRRGVAGLARLEDLGGFLGEMLQAAAGLAGAHGGAVMLLDNAGQTYRFATLLTREGIVPLGSLVGRGVPVTPALRCWIEKMADSPAGWPLAPDDPLHEPETRAFHAAQGNRALRHVPMRAGDRLLGWLDLGFAEAEPELGDSHLLLQVLADQMTLAVESLRLAEEARRAAVAREREQAAEQRAAELAKVNDTLRRGLDRVADPGRFDDYVAALLRESAEVFQADAAAVFLREGEGTTMRPVAVVDDGRLLSRREITDDFFLGTYAEVTARDPGGIMSGICASGHHQVDIDDNLGRAWPQAQAWHQARGHRISWQFPLRARGETRGFFAFALRRTNPLSATQVESVAALAQQFTLALELIRLGEEAKQAAVAGEREAASRERAAELAKVNDALRAAMEEMAAEGTMEGILGVFLREAVRVTAADAGAVLRRAGETTQFDLVAVLADGEQMDAARMADHLLTREVAEVSRRDQQGYFAELCAGRAQWRPICSPLAADLPLITAHHRQAGRKMVWDVPYTVGGTVRGYLALTFPHEQTPSGAVSEAVSALATQVGLALEMIRLAGEAQAAAVAREREQAAQERAAQLAKANAALSRSLDGLVGHGQLETFLDSVLREAITASGAVSGAVFVYETSNDTLRAVGMILRGQTLDITRDPRAAAFSRPVPATVGLVWPVVSKQHEVFWLDYSKPDPRDWPQSYEWHQAHGHRFVACIPMLLAGEAVGFLGLAFDQNEVVQPTETRLELCRVLAQQATLALHLTRLAESARESAVAREREAAAEDQIAALTETNRLLQRSAARLSAGGTPEEFTKPFLEEMYALLGADSAAQFVMDEAAGTLEGWALYDQGQWMARAAVRHARVAEIPAWAEIVAHPDRPTVFLLDNPRDVARVYPESIAFLRSRGCTWLVNLPLIVGGRVAWVLGVNGIHRDRLTEKNLAVFMALARHLALALEFHRLGEEARALAVVREREAAAQERAAELARTNAAVGDSLNELVELTDLRAFLRHVFGQCARLSSALGGGLFFHEEATDTLRKQLGWIKGEVVDFAGEAGAAFWQEPVPAATIPDWAEPVQIAAGSERIWKGARPWHKAQGYGWLSRVPLKAGAHAFGFLGMAFARREDLNAEKAELVCAMAHQIALAVQLDRLARSSEQAAVTREQEKAAREQAAELTKANAVLRRGVEQLSSPHGIRDILDLFLFEAVGIAGAAAGAVLQRVGEGTEFVLRSLTQDGAVVRDFESFTDEREYRRATGEDLDGIMRRTASGESFYYPVAGMERWFPEVAQYHRHHGHRTIGHFPFGVGGEVKGYLALGFHEDGPPGTVPTETVRTLALQASLALETQRLADEAKEAAVLAERNRIARDLHDVLAQGFVGVLAQAGALEGALEMDDPLEIVGALGRVRAIARESLNEARRSVRALRPAGQDGRLFERLQAILAGLTAGISLRSEATQTGTVMTLPEKADWAAVKFVQQALTNTLRYADAKSFQLSLEWNGEGLTLVARDDGQGFDPAASRAGIGLCAMAERAAESGGNLQVASSPGQGTILRLFLPIPSGRPSL